MFTYPVPTASFVLSREGIPRFPWELATPWRESDHTRTSPTMALSLSSPGDPRPVSPLFPVLESLATSQAMPFMRSLPFESFLHWFLASFHVAHIWQDFLISAMPFSVLWSPRVYLLGFCFCLSRFPFFGTAPIPVALRTTDTWVTSTHESPFPDSHLFTGLFHWLPAFHLGLYNIILPVKCLKSARFPTSRWPFTTLPLPSDPQWY